MPKRCIQDLVDAARELRGECLSTEFTTVFGRYRFRCKDGHEWTAKATSVLYERKWCRVCANKNLILDNLQSLKDKALERGGKCLSTEYVGTNARYEWVCQKGHTWKSSWESVRGGSWCKKCSVPRKRDGIDWIKKLGFDHGGECLSSEYLGGHHKHLWKCGVGHEWYATPYNIKNGTWCPVCSGRVITETNSLKVLYPNIASEFHPTKNTVDVESLTVKSGTKVWWICKRGHEWEAAVSKRTRSGHRGCQRCRRADFTHPELKKEFHPTKNTVVFDEVTHGSNEIFWWVCPHGHEYACSFSNRTSKTPCGCPYCSHPCVIQREIFEYVKGLGLTPTLNDRATILNPQTQKPLELDIYIQSIKFAIEFNGLFFHSEQYAPNNRHLTKALACRQAGVRLLAIYEDEWRNKRELVGAMIKRRVGILGTKIRASSLKIERLVSNNRFDWFFERNHIDGHSQASFAYGLFMGDELVSCMSVRTNHSGEKEIARAATDFDYHVYGGFGRLTKAIVGEVGPVVTFSNNSLSDGDVYKKLGAKLIQENGPSYWYTDGRQRFWRFRCKRINDPVILAKYPDVPHTEKDQASSGMMSVEALGFSSPKPLFKIEDYGHRKWLLGRLES